MTGLSAASWPALGTTATVVVAGPDTGPAEQVVRAELAAVDGACSRFRSDSELSAVNRAAGLPVRVSQLFLEALDAALRAARLTSGLVDPTLGRALRLLGYDRDFADLDPQGPPPRFEARPVPGWTAIDIDRSGRTVTVPRGVELDFGATAKALCADRAAARAARRCGAGVLVSLGGDLAVAGPTPPGGWPVGIADHHAAPLADAECTVAVVSGGLATSSTTARRWRRAGEDLHHLVDPRTGRPAQTCWKTVSVAAGSCLDANTAATAAVLMGGDAPGWLENRSLPARLAGHDGRILTVAGWAAQPDPVLR